MVWYRRGKLVSIEEMYRIMKEVSGIQNGKVKIRVDNSYLQVKPRLVRDNCDQMRLCLSRS